MVKALTEQTFFVPVSQITAKNTMAVCQSDYPLDRYQEAFIPYAEEYNALPDRQYKTVLRWMEKYIRPAQNHFGDDLLLLAHFYMGGEIVNLIEHFGGDVGDSYQLALMAARQPEKKIIVESAVHFMAESISILAHDHQKVYITNPKAGCTMEMHAKDYMVEPAIADLNERYGKENILPICYMNTSGRIKALTGEQGGAVCTSSNVKRIMEWARAKGKKILFIPDQHMGENVASWVGISPDNIAYWPGGKAGATFNLLQQDKKTLARFDRADIVLFCSECAVHTHMRPEMVNYWKTRGYHVVVHPESRKETVDAADSCGSTAFISTQVLNDLAGTKKYAVGTENHMVKNLKHRCLKKGIEVVHVADAPLSGFKGMGCGCATMSRNDPPHLVGTLDLLRKGDNLAANLVLPGDTVNEFTGQRQRLDETGRAWIVNNAKRALEKMITITEATP
jgi:quinolinate synthase